MVYWAQKTALSLWPELFRGPWPTYGLIGTPSSTLQPRSKRSQVGEGQKHRGAVDISDHSVMIMPVAIVASGAICRIRCHLPLSNPSVESENLFYTGNGFKEIKERVFIKSHSCQQPKSDEPASAFHDSSASIYSSMLFCQGLSTIPSAVQSRYHMVLSSACRAMVANITKEKLLSHFEL